MVQNYAIEQSMDVTLRQKVNGKLVPVLFSDYAESTGFDLSNETVYANKKGVKAISFKKNREGKVKFDFQIYSMKHVALFLGANQVKGTANIHKVEKAIVGGTTTKKFTIKGTPVLDSLVAYSTLADGVTHDKELAVTVSGSEVTVTTPAIADGSSVICYYLTATGENTVTTTVNAREFAGNFDIIGSTVNKNENGELGEVQFRIYNASPEGSLSLSFGGDVATLSLSFDMFPDTITGDLVQIVEIDTP